MKGFRKFVSSRVARVAFTILGIAALIAAVLAPGAGGGDD